MIGSQNKRLSSDLALSSKVTDEQLQSIKQQYDDTANGNTPNPRSFPLHGHDPS